MKKSLNKKIYLYILLAYLITWILEIPAFYLSKKYDFHLPTIQNIELYKEIGVFGTPKFYSYILFTLATYGPLLSSIITMVLYKENLRDHFSNLFKTSINKQVLIFLLFYFPGVSFLTVFISSFINSWEGLFMNPLYPLGFFVIFLLYEILTSGFEEFGWRGYLLPKLLKRMSAEKASYILGVIWSIWHWPFLYYFYDMPQIHLFIPILLGNVLSMIPVAIIYTWIYINSKGIIWPILFHALGNTVPLFIATQSENPIVASIPIVVSWVVAGVLSKRYGKSLSLEIKG
jgi:membrane protease YdiL (CAAX protease family)